MGLVRRRKLAALHPRCGTQSDELDLLVSMIGKALCEGPRQKAAEAF